MKGEIKMSINIEEILKERKTVKSGTKFKPTVYKILGEIAKEKGNSLAGTIEDLILNEYKILKGVK
jgi:hypothetical protein